MSVLSIVPADAGGCGFYRMEQPAKRYADLTKTPLGVLESGKRMPSLPQWADIIKQTGTDSILIARTFEDHQMTYWRSIKRAMPHIRLVMDFDDLLWNPCPHSSYKPTPRILANLDDIARLSDVIVASTKPMADAIWHRYKKKAKILPNAVPGSMFKAPTARSSGKLKILWAGSATHQGDFFPVVDAVKATAKKYEWHFMGWMPDELREYARFHKGVPMKDYHTALGGIGADVGIAPLAKTAFNKCKSNIKLLEYGALGMATVASAVYPYNPSAARLVTSGFTSEWIAALADMEDETKRFANAEASQAYARQFSIENMDQQILNAYN